MSAETQDSMSELVYLFVDGETTSAQEEILFNNMAGNPDLQQELQEAILIRSTLEQDCSALAVPPETTAAIFQKAGFSLPGTSSGLTVGSLIGSATQFLRSVAIPTACAVGGAVITTLFFMSKSDDSTINNLLVDGTQSKIGNQYSTPVLVSNSNADTHTLQVPPLIPSQSAKNISSVFTPNKGGSENINNEDDALLHNGNIDEQNYNNNETEEQNSLSAVSVENTHYRKTLNTPISFSAMSPARSLESSESGFKNLLTETKTMPIVLSMRGFTNITTMPNVGKGIPNNEFDNMIVSLGYNINDNVTIGLEGGSERLQYYTFENGKNNKATLHNSIMWLGSYYRQHFPLLEFSDILPYAQVSLGGTLSGPTGRLIAGLRWKPDTRISLSAGVEGNAFLYQNSAEWYSVRTLGFMYQVDVNF